MSYCVYKHTFPNGKVYIGMTGKSPETRWDNGKGYIGQSAMLRAILEFGWENIKHEIIYSELTQEEAEQKEAELISEYKSNNNEFGYNAADGGIVHRNKYIVEIHKPNYKKEKIQVIKIGINELFKASKDLKKKTSMQLYLYLCSNNNKDKLCLRAKDVCSVTGMGKQSFYNAREELEEKGYIVSINDDVYDFYTSPYVPNKD